VITQQEGSQCCFQAQTMPWSCVAARELLGVEDHLTIIMPFF
jgi:hypothetical protein